MSNRHIFLCAIIGWALFYYFYGGSAKTLFRDIRVENLDHITCAGFDLDPYGTNRLANCSKRPLHTYNDSVIYAPITPTESIIEPSVLIHPLLPGIVHNSNANFEFQESSDSGPNILERGPMVGLDVTVEQCVAVFDEETKSVVDFQWEPVDFDLDDCENPIEALASRVRKISAACDAAQKNELGAREKLYEELTRDYRKGATSGYCNGLSSSSVAVSTDWMWLTGAKYNSSLYKSNLEDLYEGADNPMSRSDLAIDMSYFANVNAKFRVPLHDIWSYFRQQPDTMTFATSIEQGTPLAFLGQTETGDDNFTKFDDSMETLLQMLSDAAVDDLQGGEFPISKVHTSLGPDGASALFESTCTFASRGNDGWIEAALAESVGFLKEGQETLEHWVTLAHSITSFFHGQKDLWDEERLSEIQKEFERINPRYNIEQIDFDALSPEERVIIDEYVRKMRYASPLRDRFPDITHTMHSFYHSTPSLMTYILRAVKSLVYESADYEAINADRTLFSEIHGVFSDSALHVTRDRAKANAVLYPSLHTEEGKRNWESRVISEKKKKSVPVKPIQTSSNALHCSLGSLRLRASEYRLTPEPITMVSRFGLDPYSNQKLHDITVQTSMIKEAQTRPESEGIKTVDPVTGKKWLTFPNTRSPTGQFVNVTVEYSENPSRLPLLPFNPPSWVWSDKKAWKSTPILDAATAAYDLGHRMQGADADASVASLSLKMADFRTREPSNITVTFSHWWPAYELEDGSQSSPHVDSFVWSKNQNDPVLALAKKWKAYVKYVQNKPYSLFKYISISPTFQLDALNVEAVGDFVSTVFILPYVTFPSLVVHFFGHMYMAYMFMFSILMLIIIAPLLPAKKKQKRVRRRSRGASLTSQASLRKLSITISQSDEIAAKLRRQFDTLEKRRTSKVQFDLSPSSPPKAMPRLSITSLPDKSGLLPGIIDESPLVTPKPNETRGFVPEPLSQSLGSFSDIEGGYDASAEEMEKQPDLIKKSLSPKKNLRKRKKGKNGNGK